MTAANAFDLTAADEAQLDLVADVDLERVTGGTTLADLGRAVIVAVQMAEGKLTIHATDLP